LSLVILTHSVGSGPVKPLMPRSRSSIDGQAVLQSGLSVPVSLLVLGAGGRGPTVQGKGCEFNLGRATKDDFQCSWPLHLDTHDGTTCLSTSHASGRPVAVSHVILPLRHLTSTGNPRLCHPNPSLHKKAANYM
jgi:hypothetical protein